MTGIPHGLVDTLDDCFANPLVTRHDCRSRGKRVESIGRMIRRSLPDVTPRQWDDWGLFGSRKGERLYERIDEAVAAALSLSDDPTLSLAALADVVADLEMPTPEADDEADTFPPRPLQASEMLSRRCAQLWQWQEDYCKTSPDYVRAIERGSNDLP